MRNGKNTLCLLLTLVLCLGLLPMGTAALAASEEAAAEAAEPAVEEPVTEEPVPAAEEALLPDGASGTCGAGLTWTLEDGLFTISGSGAVDRYGYFGSYSNEAPWYGSRSSIRAAEIGGGVSYTGQFTFYKCSNLTEVTIRPGVKTIGVGTFLNCTGLTEVVIPDTVTAIEVNAFNGCTALRTVHIPTSVTELTQHAFSWCENLSDVYYGGTEAQWKALTADIPADSELMQATVHFGGAPTGAADVNGDGSIDRKDRIALARYLAGWAGYENISLAAADVNRDGSVDRKDRIYLARALAGWDGYQLS